jgi:hypothetical protein
MALLLVVGPTGNVGGSCSRREYGRWHFCKSIPARNRPKGVSGAIERVRELGQGCLVAIAGIQEYEPNPALAKDFSHNFFAGGLLVHNKIVGGGPSISSERWKANETTGWVSAWNRSIEAAIGIALRYDVCANRLKMRLFDGILGAGGNSLARRAG